MPIKVMRYQIIKPINIDWKLFNEILNELTYQTTQILNKSIQYTWEFEGFASDYKEKYGQYPKKKDILKYSNLHGYIYNILKNKYNKMNSQNLSQTIKRAVDKFNSDKLDILKGNKSIINFKKKSPLDVVKNNIKIYKENNEYYIDISLISTSYKKELGLKSGKVLILLKVKDNTQKTILDKILNGEYSISASQILKHKNKWFLNLTYNFKNKIKELDKNRILGIDLGIVNTATLQIYDENKKRYEKLKWNKCMLEGKELIHYKQKIQARKTSLQKQSKVAGDGRIGHGYNTRMKPLSKISEKESNFRKTFNHKYSKYIVEFAEKNNCGVIQMENLTNIKDKRNKMLGNWSYYDLQQKIKYKAEERGIEFRLVNPKHTSQRCSKCGYIHKDNRKEQANFKCINCGYTENADINAAKNIAIPYIDKIIEEQLKLQENINNKSA